MAAPPRTLSESCPQGLYAALCDIGSYGRGWRIAHCTPERLCGDKLCPTCQWRWISPVVEKLTRDALAQHADAWLTVTLPTWAPNARLAVDELASVLRVRRRRTGVVLLGAKHLFRLEHGWLAHVHALIPASGAMTRERVVQDWRRAGGNRNAWVEPTKSVRGSIVYAVEGAVIPERNVGAGSSPLTRIADWRDWLLATRHRPLVVRPRSTSNRGLSTATPTDESTEHARNQLAEGATKSKQLERRVLQTLRPGPQSASEIKKAVQSGRRKFVDEHLKNLLADGKIRCVATKKTFRYVLVANDQREMPMSP